MFAVYSEYSTTTQFCSVLSVVKNGLLMDGRGDDFDYDSFESIK
jgi:hypothetical protein